MKGLSLLDFLQIRDYFQEVFNGRTAWLTPIIHFKVFGVKPVLFFLLRIPALRKMFLSVDWRTRERIIENNLLYCFLDKLHERSQILDIGYAESTVSLELASMGYKVTGIDMRDFPMTHPNFSSVIGNICQMPFKDESFDLIISISTIEHIGISSYGMTAFPEGDAKAIKEILRCLKPNGLFYLTVPFGGTQTTAWQRIYNSQSLNSLLRDFEILVSKYYRRYQYKFWLPATAEELEKVPSTVEEGVNGVAIKLCSPRSK
ncbi:MAG: class I SAM-dependent methyltransferase [Elusimicrobia bacterium]|nr:class I SAM-dependent methyltransferase [Elusimicrobiota bacterium]